MFAVRGIFLTLPEIMGIRPCKLVTANDLNSELLYPTNFGTDAA